MGLLSNKFLWGSVLVVSLFVVWYNWPVHKQYAKIIVSPSYEGCDEYNGAWRIDSVIEGDTALLLKLIHFPYKERAPLSGYNDTAGNDRFIVSGYYTGAVADANYYCNGTHIFEADTTRIILLPGKKAEVFFSLKPEKEYYVSGDTIKIECRNNTSDTVRYAINLSQIHADGEVHRWAVDLEEDTLNVPRTEIALPGKTSLSSPYLLVIEENWLNDTTDRFRFSFGIEGDHETYAGEIFEIRKKAGK